MFYQNGGSFTGTMWWLDLRTSWNRMDSTKHSSLEKPRMVYKETGNFLTVLSDILPFNIWNSINSINILLALFTMETQFLPIKLARELCIFQIITSSGTIQTTLAVTGAVWPHAFGYCMSSETRHKASIKCKSPIL